MKYTLSSDNHLGTRRQAHTTRDSSDRLRQMLYTQSLVATSNPTTKHLNLGDLLDRATNDEATLLQAYAIGKRYEVVLAGNHDEVNRSEVVTTLHALKAVGVNVVCSPDLTAPNFQQVDKYFFFIPHHASQEIFMEALQMACNEAAKCDHNTYLMLHCNYDWPEINQLSDNTLNLEKGDAEVLLTVFNRIFIGHEHKPKTDFGDRLVLVGNLFPTSFSDISDKFIWHLDPENDELDKECICTESKVYREVKYGEPIPNLDDVLFVDVVGSTEASNAVDVANAVRAVWGTSDRLLAVRNKVELNDGLHHVDIDASTPTLVDLSGRIRTDLKGTDLLPIYDRLAATAEAS